MTEKKALVVAFGQNKEERKEEEEERVFKGQMGGRCDI